MKTTILKPLYLPLEERVTVSRVFRSLYLETTITFEEYGELNREVYETFQKERKENKLPKLAEWRIYHPLGKRKQKVYPTDFIPTITKIIRKHVFLNKKKNKE
jgi:hypothetical protein